MDQFNRSRNLISRLRPHRAAPLGCQPLRVKTSRRERARLLAMDYRIDELERMLDSEFATLDMAPFIAELAALTAARG